MMSKNNENNSKNKHKENEAWDEIKTVRIYYKFIWLKYITSNYGQF